MSAFVKVFEGAEVFEAYHAAEKWLRERGYSAGSTCVMSPCGVKKGDCYIAKWRNLTPRERNLMDGTLDGDFRNGPVTLRLKVVSAELLAEADGKEAQG